LCKVQDQYGHILTQYDKALKIEEIRRFNAMVLKFCNCFPWLSESCKCNRSVEYRFLAGYNQLTVIALLVCIGLVEYCIYFVVFPDNGDDLCIAAKCTQRKFPKPTLFIEKNEIKLSIKYQYPGW